MLLFRGLAGALGAVRAGGGGRGGALLILAGSAAAAGGGGTNIAVRFKGVLTQVYNRRAPASKRKHIGVRATSGQYVQPGSLLVRQRKHIAFNPFVTRRRHFRIYPGENVRVDSKSSLYSLAFGRLKFTHDVSRDVLVANVLPEVREDIATHDFWRYRTEHVRSMEENRNLCWLRTKAGTIFAKPVASGPRKAPPSSAKKGWQDIWENEIYPDSRDRLRGYRNSR